MPGNSCHDTGSRWSLERLGPRVRGWGGVGEGACCVTMATVQPSGSPFPHEYQCSALTQMGKLRPRDTCHFMLPALGYAPGIKTHPRCVPRSESPAGDLGDRSEPLRVSWGNPRGLHDGDTSITLPGGCEVPAGATFAPTDFSARMLQPGGGAHL